MATYRRSTKRRAIRRTPSYGSRSYSSAASYSSRYPRYYNRTYATRPRTKTGVYARYKKYPANRTGLKRTKKDKEYSVVVTNAPGVYDPATDIIPPNGVRYRLQHISNPSVVSNIEGKVVGKVIWKGIQDAVEIEADDDTILECRTIFFRGDNTLLSHADNPNYISPSRNNTPDASQHFASCSPIGAIGSQGTAEFFRTLFTDKTVYGAIQGSINQQIPVIADRHYVVVGKDGGSVAKKKSKVYLRADKKPIVIEYASSGATFADTPMSDTLGIFRLDVFARGVKCRNLTIGAVGAATHTPVSSRSSSSGSDGKKGKIKEEPMDFDHKVVMSEMELLEREEDSSGAGYGDMNIRITTRVFYEI